MGNLAISGVCLLTFMTIHLFQFRFGETEPYKICPPPYLVNVKGLLHLALFWVGYEGCTSINVRDIYRLEFEIFKSWGWVMFYLSRWQSSVRTCVLAGKRCCLLR